MCEEEETRTPTTQLSLPPQSSASTNSATSPTFKYHFEYLCPRQDSNLHVEKHTHLKRARLPIPPLGLKFRNTEVEYFLFERKTGLGPATPTLARLCSTNWAISACSFSRSEEEETRTPTTQLSLPPQSSASTNSATSPFSKTPYSKQNSCCFKMLSGKRDSDPRPQPWQGCALPTELFPLIS